MKARWVERYKNGVCKSRFVAMEVVYTLRDDYHAGAPPIAMTRYIISDAATKEEDGEVKVLAVGDITCAFLHAEMPADEPPIYLLFPEGLAPPGARGRLKCSLYGTRRASFLWGAHTNACLTCDEGGFTRSRGCGSSTSTSPGG